MSGDAAVVNTVGVILLEVYIAVFLYGMLTMQGLVYWTKYRTDETWVRSGVGLIWILETIHTVFCLHLVYSYAIIDWGDAAATGSVVWSFSASTLTAVFIAVFAQSFLGWRMYILSHKNLWITAPLAMLLIIRTAFGCCAVAIGEASKTWVHWRSLSYGRALLTCAISSSAVTDLYIWVLLLYILQRSLTGSQRTEVLIRRLQAYVVISGCLTMFISLAIILTSVFLGNSLLFVGLMQIQSKMYANCFLASLNARMLWRAEATPSSGVISMELVGVAKSSGQTHRNDTRRIEVFRSVTSTTDNMVGSIGRQEKKTTLSMQDTPVDEESEIAKADAFPVDAFKEL